MAYELGVLPDGELVLMTDQPPRKDIKRVEYYRDQKLLMMVYEGDRDDGDLMEYELSDQAADLVHKTTQNILVVDAHNPQSLRGFDVPLIQVGV